MWEEVDAPINRKLAARLLGPLKFKYQAAHLKINFGQFISLFYWQNVFSF